MSTNVGRSQSGTQVIQNIPWLKKGTRLERILCFVTVASLLTVAVLIILVAYFGYHFKNNSVSGQGSLRNVCLKPACVRTAAALLSSLDENVDPCNDFYHFMCGEWIKTHTIPEDDSYISVLHEPEKRLNLQLKDLLEADLNGTEPSFIVMAKKLYHTCMNTESTEEAGAEPLKNVLKNLKGWPVVEGRKWNKRKFDWLETLINLRKLGYSHNYLISLSVDADTENSPFRIIHLDETSLGVDRTYLIDGLNDSATAAYYKKMVKTAVLLGADESVAEKELLEALQFEITLANYCLPEEERGNKSNLYNKYTVKALQKMIPQIPWLKFISGLLNKNTDENEPLIVAVPEFIKKFADLITSTEKRVIANYMLWRVVDESIAFLSKEWRDINEEYLAVLSDESKEEAGWKKCISSNLKVALSSYYVRHHFNKKAKEQVSKIVKYVYEELLRILDENDWMDKKTKSHAKAKANSMTFIVGYQKELLNDTAVKEYYNNLVIHNDSYFENILRINKWKTDKDFSKLREPIKRYDWEKRADVAIINAFYHDSENQIELPAGYLQNPFFDQDRPNYMNFAMIGSAVGHEITHGFDNEGRQYDKDGNKTNWWEKATDEKFKEKTQCIIEQYGNYTAENGMNVNGVNTQGENIADNGGLKQSYWAYQSWVKDNSPEQLLPGLKYNQNQLFWIGAASEYCTKYSPKMLNDTITSDSHTPSKFRVIGSMSNLVEFVRDFNCPPNSPMNRKHKCQVW